MKSVAENLKSCLMTSVAIALVLSGQSAVARSSSREFAGPKHVLRGAKAGEMIKLLAGKSFRVVASTDVPGALLYHLDSLYCSASDGSEPNAGLFPNCTVDGKSPPVRGEDAKRLTMILKNFAKRSEGAYDVSLVAVSCRSGDGSAKVEKIVPTCRFALQKYSGPTVN